MLIFIRLKILVIQIIYSLFYDVLNDKLYAHAPKNEKRINYEHQPEWFTSEIKEVIRKRDKLDKRKKIHAFKIKSLKKF